MSIRDMWRYLIFQTKGYRIIEVAIVLGALSGAAVAYVNSIVYARIIDALMLSDYDSAVRFTIIMVASVFLLNVLYNGASQIIRHYAKPSMEETRKRTADKAFRLEYEELEKEDSLIAFWKVRNAENSSGDIEDQLMNIYEFFMLGVKAIFALGFLILIVVKAVGNMGTDLSIVKMIIMTALLIGFFSMALYVNYITSKKIGEEQVRINVDNEKGNQLSGYLFRVIGSEKNAKDIRVNGLFDYFQNKMKSVLVFGKMYSRYGRITGRYQGQFTLIVQVLAGYIYIYVALMAVYGAVSIGDVIMYAGAIITMMDGVQQIILLKTHIDYCNEYIKTYEEFINRPNMHYDGTLPIEKRDDNRYELALRNVSFRYPGTKEYTIKNLSLNFNIGEKVALVGLNGAGKTTVIKLLLRLYEPTEGTITLNGIDIAKYDYEEYVNIFSVVFQDYRLFSMPIDENIASGADVDETKLNEVLAKVGMLDRINELPNGVKTNLYHDNGEGVALSGGEAEKLTIARALYKDAPFVILDEPTAALDPIAEAEVYENFDSLVGGKTTIYISHRMSSCKFCDRIIVINNGGIAEEGNHNNLLGQGGLYAQLYNIQAEYYF